MPTSRRATPFAPPLAVAALIPAVLALAGAGGVFPVRRFLGGAIGIDL
jgi:hypothetical protein